MKNILALIFLILTPIAGNATVIVMEAFVNEEVDGNMTTWTSSFFRILNPVSELGLEVDDFGAFSMRVGVGDVTTEDEIGFVITRAGDIVDSEIIRSEVFSYNTVKGISFLDVNLDWRFKENIFKGIIAQIEALPLGGNWKVARLSIEGLLPESEPYIPGGGGSTPLNIGEPRVVVLFLSGLFGVAMIFRLRRSKKAGKEARLGNPALKSVGFFTCYSCF